MKYPAVLIHFFLRFVRRFIRLCKSHLEPITRTPRKIVLIYAICPRRRSGLVEFSAHQKRAFSICMSLVCLMMLGCNLKRTTSHNNIVFSIIRGVYGSSGKPTRTPLQQQWTRQHKSIATLTTPSSVIISFIEDT